jgi:2-polyprenyl-3-methyl-5-hydroxy-6-metoxy-1,4-benzoquinol methylase
LERDLHRAHADLDESHWWFLGRRRIIEATIARHFAGRPDASVVDVGCGSGGLLTTLLNFGRVAAVEADAEAASIAADRNPLADVVQGSIPDVLEDVPIADLMTAFDVIEHLDDDVGALAQLRQRIASGGTLCVTVPALPILWSEHDDANEHRRRYTRSSLRAALEGAGFVVTHVSYFNTLLLPLVAAARISERLRRPARTSGDLDRSLGSADRLLEWAFSLERYVVPRWPLPVGVSLIAVASPHRE